MATTRNQLPQNLTPNGDICIPVSVPDDGEWLAILMHAISIPTLQRYWVNSVDGDNDKVRREWENRVYIPLANTVIGSGICADESVGSLGSCFRLDTTTEAFEFYPNDPFTDKDNDAGKILSHTKFARFADLPINEIPLIGDFIENVLGGVSGYFDNDIFITEDLLSPFSNPLERLGDMVNQITSFPLPYVKIELEGAGQLEVELVNVPEGGSVLLIPDLDVSLQSLWDTVVDLVDNDGSLPATWMLTEVNRNIVGFELVATQVQEFEFTEDDVHTMHVIFVPIPKLTPPFINAFGGIREIEVCGSLRIIGTQTGNEINKSNFKQADIIREGIIAMTTTQEICDGMLCAFETVAQRILLAKSADNIEGDVLIGKDDSSITIKSFGSLLTPTLVSSNEEARSGGVYRQAQGIADLLSEAESLKVAGFTAPQIINISKLVIKPLDETAWETKVTAYFNSAENVVIDVEALAEHLYCSTVGVAVVQYATEIVSSNPRHTANETDFLVQFVAEIPTTTFNDWFNEGSFSPRDNYLSYGCYLIPSYDILPDISVLDDASAPYWTLPADSLNLKPVNNRWKIDFSGQWTHSDGRVMDGFYYQVNAGDAYTSLESELAVRTQAFTGQEHEVDNYPDYNATHNYSVFFSSATDQTFIRGVSFPVKPANSTGWTGTITMTVTDLGVS